MELPPLIKAILLGLVEGATEFVPVSSTGHLILAEGKGMLSYRRAVHACGSLLRMLTPGMAFSR